jgi:excinuclease ABC subunit A
VIVVEHDEDAIRLADHVVDIGPGAGVHGGEVVAQGSCRHPEGAALAHRAIPVRQEADRGAGAAHPPNRKLTLKLKGARGNNLKNVDLEIPSGLFTCVTGVSGSGKSTLINDTLYRAGCANEINGASHTPAPYREITGLDLFDKVVDIDQSPIGRTPRSNPATYTGLFTPMRELFAQVPEARARGYARAFQLQRQGRPLRSLPGRRPDQGRDALPAGRVRALRRLPGQALQPRDAGDPLQGHSIRDVLEMTVEDALELFEPVPS